MNPNAVTKLHVQAIFMPSVYRSLDLVCIVNQIAQFRAALCSNAAGVSRPHATPIRPQPLTATCPFSYSPQSVMPRTITCVATWL